MNHRLTIAAAVAVILTSLSEWVLIGQASWLFASMGAVIIIALAGTLTRLAPLHAAIGATALAALVSVPLLAAPSIWLKVLGALLIAICAASATRLRFLVPVADAVTYLAALLLYLNLILSHAKSVGLLVPTARSLHHLGKLVNGGMLMAKQPPPVESTPGIVLLAAASIGLAAIVVDILAVRMRKPAIAGLPLLVIFMAPIATAARATGPGSIITFLLAATGYLGLLASDGRHRLRGWGRIITVWHYAGEDDRLGGADIRGLAATGRRIGLAAVCAAIVAPLLLPSLNVHRLFARHTGGVHRVAVGLPLPLVQLSKLLTSPTNAHVLTYRTAANSPGQYLQVYALNYDSSKNIWSLITPTKPIAVGVTPLRSPAGISPTVHISKTTAQVQLGNVNGAGAGFASSIFFLPVPYFPTQLSIGDSWNASLSTGMIYSGSGNHAYMKYTVTGGQADITPADEAAANGTPPTSITKLYGSFKSPVSAQLLKIANRITKNSNTQFAKAQALENYFQHGGFTYTIKTNLTGSPRALLRFLTTDKRGFCEQFAFAMAALARLAGIPSRIAVGYTSGTEAQAGVWKVTTADAHAWPELYFSGLGWVRFEPTPGGSAGQGTAVQPSYGSPAKVSTTGPKTGPNPIGTTKSSDKTDPGSIIHHVNAPGQGAGPIGEDSNPGGAKTPPPIGQIALALLIVLLIGAVIPGVARGVTRRRRWHKAADDTTLANAAWQEICADLDDYGIARRASESPRAIAHRLSTDVGLDEDARQAVRRIATVVEICRYAPTPVTADGVRADVTQVRRSLARSSTWMIRLKAKLLPASTIVPFAENLRQNLGQVTGWMPSATQT